MTTMSEPGTDRSGHAPGAARTLRRSTTDRVISGVAGGLGRYFGVDPVIFRVLFAVLSFFGGVGLLAYGVAWMLVPEPDAGTSLLDRVLHELRVRKVPPWLVVLGGAVLVWLAWFSWWAPGTLPAVLLLAVVVLVLMRRLVNRPQPMPTNPPWAGAAPATPPWAAASTTTAETTPDLASAGSVMPADDLPEPARLWPDGPQADEAQPEDAQPDPTRLIEAGSGNDAVSLSKETVSLSEDTVSLSGETGSGWTPPYQPGYRSEFGSGFGSDQADTRLIPPLADTRRSMQAWLTEAGEAHRQRVQRRRPIKVAVGLGLLIGWGFVAMLDAFTRVPFPAYLWAGLAIVGAGLLVSLVTRRTTLSLLVPLLFLVVLTVGLGGTRASLSDGSGDIGWRPSTPAELTTYRQFAGRSTLDLTGLGSTGTAAEVSVTQAAGAVFVKIPASMNATVIADVHFGDIRNGTSEAVGDYQSGMNVHLRLNPPATATGAPLTIHVHLTDGHVQVDRV